MINEFVQAWLRIPQNFEHKIDSVFALYNLRYSVELVTASYTRIFYNKFTVLVSEFFRALTFLTPSFYFCNIFLFLFFPFWLAGILYLIKVGDFQIFIKLLLVTLIVYLMGEKNIFFLWPIAIFYIYFIFIGIKQIWPKN